METNRLEAQIHRFVARLARQDVNMHGFMLSVDGALLAKAYYAPFREGQPHRMYSVSKTMTALAIGMLAEAGALSLDDRIAAFFGDWLPESPSPWLTSLTIRDMLRMATCHKDATYREGIDANWARTFFQVAPTHAPGTMFNYDTSCSQVLAALVKRLTGEEVIDFLDRRLFIPLGATDEKHWLRDPSGCCQGGTGLCMSLRDLHKVSQCLLEGGRGLVPEWFVREMGEKHVETTLRENAEERFGYGWQCWRTRAGWSMYGLGGQLAILCPDKRALLTTIADTRLDGQGVQHIYDAFFEELYPHLDGAAGPALELALAPKGLEHRQEYALSEAGTFAFPEGNPLNLRTLRLRGDRLCYENARGPVELPFACGAVREITYPGWPEVPALAEAGWIGPGLLRLRCHAIGDAPCGFDMLVCFRADTATVQVRRSHDPLTEGYDGIATGTKA